MEPLVIAIDGPAASGKTSVSRALAANLGFAFFSSGWLYRACAVLFMDTRHPAESINDSSFLGFVQCSYFDYTSEQRLIVNGTDRTDELEDPTVGALTSKIAQISEIRHRVTQIQRFLVRKHAGAVVEGRDIGTVVFPDAPVKFYLDAPPEVRAWRAHKRDTDAGRHTKSVEELTEDLRQRDTRDKERALSPLRPARDAISIDTSSLGFEEVVQELTMLTRQRLSVIVA